MRERTDRVDGRCGWESAAHATLQGSFDWLRWASLEAGFGQAAQPTGGGGFKSARGAMLSGLDPDPPQARIWSGGSTHRRGGGGFKSAGGAKLFGARPLVRPWHGQLDPSVFTACS